MDSKHIKVDKCQKIKLARARVKVGGRVSSYQVMQPLTYIFEPLIVAQIKRLLQTLFMYAYKANTLNHWSHGEVTVYISDV